jgi:hypothetical protein
VTTTTTHDLNPTLLREYEASRRREVPVAIEDLADEQWAKALAHIASAVAEAAEMSTPVTEKQEFYDRRRQLILDLVVSVWNGEIAFGLASMVPPISEGGEVSE